MADQEDALVQMQIGTLAALVAICDALIAERLIEPRALIERLGAVSDDEGRLGPYARNTIDGLIKAIEGLAVTHAARGEPH